jgi:hypothetical protein
MRAKGGLNRTLEFAPKRRREHKRATWPTKKVPLTGDVAAMLHVEAGRSSHACQGEVALSGTSNGYQRLTRDLDVLGFGALCVFDDVEGYRLTFSKAAESTGDNGGVMDENVLATVIALDEPETLLIVKPLHLARGHTSDSF